MTSERLADLRRQQAEIHRLGPPFAAHPVVDELLEHIAELEKLLRLAHSAITSVEHNLFRLGALGAQALLTTQEMIRRTIVEAEQPDADRYTRNKLRCDNCEFRTFSFECNWGKDPDNEESWPLCGDLDQCPMQEQSADDPAEPRRARVGQMTTLYAAPALAAMGLALVALRAWVRREIERRGGED